MLLFYLHGAARGESYFVKSLPLADARASLGINVHIGSKFTPYSKITQSGRDPQSLLNMLRFTGISLLRSGIPGAYGEDSVDLLTNEQASLAKAGIRFDLQIVSPRNLDARIARVARFAESNPGAVVAIEGMNEVTSSGIEYGNLEGKRGAVALQKAVYEAVRRYPQLSKTEVYAFSPHPNVKMPPQELFGSLAGGADALNIHAYPLDNDLPLTYLRRTLSKSRGILKGAPVVVTESGAPTLAPGQLGGVSQEVQAKYLLNFIFDNILNDSQAEYVYELIDSGEDKANYNPENHFGIYNADASPKQSAYTLHNLSQILAGGGGGGGGAAKASDRPVVEFDIKGLPGNTNKLVLDDGGHELYLVLWIEKKLWDAKTHIMSQNVEINGTVSCAGTGRLAFFDPLTGATAIRSASAGTRLAIELADHPIIVMVSK